MYPGHPGFPPYIGDSNWGCDPFPDGNTVGPVIAPAVPWIEQYRTNERVKSGYRGGTGTQIDYLLEPNAMPRGCRTYWHIECFANEKQFTRENAQTFFGGNTSVTEQIGAMHGFRPSSQLKLLVEWLSARQEKRFLIADIGTGIDLKIGPTTHPTAMLYVPRDDTNPVIPSQFAGLEDEVTGTIVTARATPTTGQGTAFNGRYTQTHLFNGTTVPWLHQIPSFARDVQAFATPATTTPTALSAPVLFDFVFDTMVSGALAQIPLGIAGYANGGAVAGAQSPDSIMIPQNAKFVRVDVPADLPAFVTLVYKLSL